MIYIRCPKCGARFPRGESCKCGRKREYAPPQGTRELYHTWRWQQLRDAVIKQYNGLDPYAYSQGRLEAADTVHHIIPAGDEPGLFWTASNLIPLSRASHDEVHTAYRKDARARSDMINRLRELTKDANHFD